MIDRALGRAGRRRSGAVAPAVPADIQAEADAAWRGALAAIDLASARAMFLADGELLVLEDLLPAALVERVLAELDRARLSRSWMPWVRAAAHVGWRQIQRVAPLAAAIYRSPVFLGWMGELVGRPLLLKDDADDHACATYEYDRPGDGMAFHYDGCGCDEGASYTQLLALCDRSTQRLLVDLHTRDDQPVERRVLQTRPGTLVIFCGSKVWHGVSPLGVGERRVVLSMSFASDPTMAPWRRLYENVKDAILYFGPSAALQPIFGPRRGAATGDDRTLGGRRR